MSGASLIQEVANKTNEAAGDGTTTATVLAQKMMEEAFEAAALASTQANEIKKGMDAAVGLWWRNLNKVKKEVKNKEEIQQVATIASLDDEVGKLIAEAMEEVGHEGVITVEEGQTTGLEKEVVKGMRFDKGFVNPLYGNQCRKNGSRVGRRLYFNYGQKSFHRAGNFADFGKSRAKRQERYW